MPAQAPGSSQPRPKGSSQSQPALSVLSMHHGRHHVQLYEWLPAASHSVMSSLLLLPLCRGCEPASASNQTCKHVLRIPVHDWLHALANSESSDSAHFFYLPATRMYHCISS